MSASRPPVCVGVCSASGDAATGGASGALGAVDLAHEVHRFLRRLFAQRLVQVALEVFEGAQRERAVAAAVVQAHQQAHGVFAGGVVGDDALGARDGASEFVRRVAP